MRRGPGGYLKRWMTDAPPFDTEWERHAACCASSARRAHSDRDLLGRRSGSFVGWYVNLQAPTRRARPLRRHDRPGARVWSSPTARGAGRTRTSSRRRSRSASSTQAEAAADPRRGRARDRGARRGRRAGRTGARRPTGAHLGCRGTGMWSEGEIVVRREVLNDGRCWLEVAGAGRRETSCWRRHPRGAPFTFPPGRGRSRPVAIPGTGKDALGGQRRADAAASRRGVRDLGVLVGPEREFRGWYVNLQEPFRRTADGFDTQDLELDIWVAGRRAVGSGRTTRCSTCASREGRFTPSRQRPRAPRAGASADSLDAGERWWATRGATRVGPPGRASHVRCQTRHRSCDALCNGSETARGAPCNPRCREDTSGVRHQRTPPRLPTLLAFVTLGLFWGAWASVLPSVQQATGASKGALGFALLFVTLGVDPGDALRRRADGRPLRRAGGRASVRGLRGGDDAAGPRRRRCRRSIARAVAAGAASGALDVGINANAARIETDTGSAPDAARARPLLGGDPRRRGAAGPRAQPRRPPRADPARGRRSRSPLTASCSATDRAPAQPNGAAARIADRARAAPARARRRGRLHRRGRDRELERALPRAAAATRSPAVSGSAPASSAARWRSAASSARRRDSATGRCSSAARRSAPSAACRRDRAEPGGRARRVRTRRRRGLAERADRLRRRRPARRERGRDGDDARLRRAADRAAARRRRRASVARCASRSSCSPWSRPP